MDNAQLPPGPSYIPGYTGRCPLLKFSIAKSHKLTNELLSQRVPIPPIHHKNLIRIPNQDYTETCRKSLTEFYQEEQERIQRSVELPLISSQHRPEPPRGIPDKVFSFKPLNPFIPPGRPYSMDDTNPMKYYMPGFTGHVPTARFIDGKTFALTTNQALIAHRKQQNAKENRRKSTAPSSSSHRGVIPAFTGHIQGYKFMYGQTFGQISQKLLEKANSEKIHEEKSQKLLPTAK